MSLVLRVVGVVNEQRTGQCMLVFMIPRREVGDLIRPPAHVTVIDFFQLRSFQGTILDLNHDPLTAGKPTQRGMELLQL